MVFVLEWRQLVAEELLLEEETRAVTNLLHNCRYWKLKSIYRLKKNYQYNYVYKHAKSIADGNFVMLYCTSNNKQSKVGFSISKKYGHAVMRNRIRRQLKAVVSQYAPNLKNNFNVIFIPRKSQPYLFEEIDRSVQKLLSKASLLQWDVLPLHC